MSCSKCADAEQGGCSCWETDNRLSMVEAVRDRRRNESGGSYYSRPDPRTDRPSEEYTSKMGVKGRLAVYITAPIGRIPVHGKRGSDMDREEWAAWREAKEQVDNGNLESGVEKIIPRVAWWGIAVTWWVTNRQ